MRSTRDKHFPNELRESVARRYLSTNATYRELAAEIGSSTWSVRDWVRQFREQGTVGKKRTKRPAPTDQRSAEEKFRLLLQARSMKDEERGEYLRREGIHDADLERWEQEALGGLTGAAGSESQERRIRELERDNKQQGKRLKEAAALLELQKKVQALWADEGDDTSHS